MTTYKIPDCGKGVNKDLLPAELEDGWWSDCLNIRFRNGFAEKFEGIIAKDTGATISSATGAFLFPFKGSAGQVAVYGNRVKAYALISSAHTEITRYRKSETISTITRIAANTAEVTTASAHGLVTNDVVTHFGATESAYNQTQASITRMSDTVYRYTTTNTISGNATVVGSYVVYTSAASSDFQQLPTFGMGGALNGIFFLYGPIDGLYSWAGNVSVRMRQVPFTVTASASAVRPFKNYLVLLADRTVSWTDAAEPGAIPTTFTASDTNDAGQATLAETPGSLMDCLPLGDVNIVYKKDSMYAMQYIGGNDVFRFSRIPGEDGLYLPWCVVNTPKGHVFLTQNFDIKIHQGGTATSIAEGRVRKYFESSFDTTSHAEQVFLVVNPEKSEVWVCFATTSSTRGCDRAIVWNWEADTWGIFSLGSPVGSGADGIAFAASGHWPSELTSKSRLFTLNTALDFNMIDSSATSSMTATLERTGMHMGDRDTFKSIQRSRWNVDGTAGDTLSVYHGSSKTADGTVTWTSPSTYTIGTTDYANARATAGRFGGVKFSISSTAPMLLRSIDLDVTGGGKR